VFLQLPELSLALLNKLQEKLKPAGRNLVISELAKLVKDPSMNLERLNLLDDNTRFVHFHQVWQIHLVSLKR